MISTSKVSDFIELEKGSDYKEKQLVTHLQTNTQQEVLTQKRKSKKRAKKRERERTSFYSDNGSES